MKSNIGLAFGAALLLGAVASSASAGTIGSLSDNFDTEHGSSPTLNYYGFSNWTVSTASNSAHPGAGSVDLIGNGSFDSYSGNGLYVDMCGSTGACGALTTKDQFAAGTYRLTLSLGGIIYPPSNGYGALNDNVLVSFSGTGAGSADVPTSYLAISTYSEIITLSQPAYLTLQDAVLSGNENIGATLLSVNVSPVPLPAALPLFGVAVAGFAAWGRKRAKKASAVA